MFLFFIVFLLFFVFTEKDKTGSNFFRIIFKNCRILSAKNVQFHVVVFLLLLLLKMI